MKENGLKTEKLALESILIPTIKNIKEIGWMDKNMEKGHITIKMVIFILDNGLKIKKMETVSYNILIKQFMMVNGLMINLVIKDK